MNLPPNSFIWFTSLKKFPYLSICLFETWNYLYFQEISYLNCAKIEEIFRENARMLIQKIFCNVANGMKWTRYNGLAILFRWHYNALPYQSMWLWQQPTIELCTYDVLRTTKDFHYVEVLIWYIGQVISYQDQIGIWFLLQDYNFSFQSRQKKLQWVYEIAKFET